MSMTVSASGPGGNRQGHGIRQGSARGGSGQPGQRICPVSFSSRSDALPSA